MSELGDLSLSRAGRAGPYFTKHLVVWFREPLRQLVLSSVPTGLHSLNWHDIYIGQDGP